MENLLIGLGLGAVVGAVVYNMATNRYVPVFVAGNSFEAEQVVAQMLAAGVEAYAVSATGDWVVMVRADQQDAAKSLVPF